MALDEEDALEARALRGDLFVDSSVGDEHRAGVDRAFGANLCAGGALALDEEDALEARAPHFRVPHAFWLAFWLVTFLSMYDRPVQWYVPAAVTLHRGRSLPHLELAGSIQFVTFRLADSIPADRLRIWLAQRDAWLAANPLPHTREQTDYLKRIYTQRIHKYLDAGHGACVLKAASFREVIETTIRQEDGLRYALGDYVVMPNHVHLLVQADVKVHELAKQWKRITSHRINRALSRTGDLWQSEPFDHMLRDPAALGRAKQYIRDNPRFLRPGMFSSGSGTASW